MEEIGQRVRELRAHLQISQKDMAAALGITPPSLSSLESNNSGVSLNVFRNLVRIYDANPYWLLFGEGSLVRANNSVSDPPDFIARLAEIQNQVDDLRRQLGKS